MTLTVDTSQVKAQLSEFIGRVDLRPRATCWCCAAASRWRPWSASKTCGAWKSPTRAAGEPRECLLMHPIMRVYGRWAES